jgi:uncharacterized protein YndB with AHSA1/START domain
MDAGRDSQSPATKNQTSVERTSDREVVVRRTINGPPHVVFEAFTRPELFRRWWVPKSFGLSLLSCETDARVGGKYRLVFDLGDSQTMAFYGTYTEVVRPSRLAWTNEESGDAGAVTTVTFEDQAGKTLVVMRDLYPSKEALDAGIGSTEGLGESFQQLDELLVTLGENAGQQATV